MQNLSSYLNRWESYNVTSFYSHFQDRRTDIVANKGAIFNQRDVLLIQRIEGKLYAKIMVLTQEMRSDILSSNFWDRQTYIVAYRGAVYNQKRSRRVYWILGRVHAKNQGSEWRDKKDIHLIMTDQPKDGQEGS